MGIDFKVFGFFSLNVILITYMFGDLWVRWNEIPDLIPTSFKLNGQSKDEKRKEYLIFLPIISFILCVLLYFLNLKLPEGFYPIEFKDKDLKSKFERSTKIYLQILGFLYNLIMFYINYTMSKSKELNIIPMIVLSVILIGIIILYSNKVDEFIEPLQEKPKDDKKEVKDDKKDEKKSKDNEAKKTK
ncbi:hypothetical protein BCR32DRAFT_296313 [Anaeromyces robustus]|jgi:uncharacterized membrane protein|uniref:DUF1648 domain-containing protein n=1 Tax=Anaeromyces robustus TaxID=1754192 RepID=A0A1Y1WRY7_9FUNG|nr:hypothetical protein BCR32DRAFT_296313 [Anaeromyces robustus]|eukprot:ORX76311.1 hypothetical protein BCR32DRAFT_296313 [Anaeromyces robustus]